MTPKMAPKLHGISLKGCTNALNKVSVFQYIFIIRNVQIKFLMERIEL